MSDNEFSGRDLFTLTDEASIQLKHDLGIPGGHIESVRDFPVAALLTNSMPALEAFCMGVESTMMRGEWVEGTRHLERAVELDSTFAYGHMALWDFYQVTNAADKAAEARQAMMRHLYRLPERAQYFAKLNYYFRGGEPDKALSVVHMMIDLYPNDIEAHDIMARLRLVRNERELAIRQYERILEIDPSRTENLENIAWQYRQLGDYAAASTHFEAYVAKHPEDAGGYHALGNLYEIRGMYDEAKDYYAKTLVIDPARGSIFAELGDIDRKLGNDAGALANFERAFELAKTPQERNRVYGSTVEFYYRRGQMERSVEQLRLRWVEQKKYLPPVNMQLETLGDLRYLMWAGREKEALEIIESTKGKLAPPYDQLLSIGYLSVFTESGEPEKASEALVELNAYIKKYNMEGYRASLCNSEGQIEELRGDFEAAIKCYQRNVELDPTNTRIHRRIGRCYRELKRYDDAMSSLKTVVKRYPYSAEANYELALTHDAMGDRATAVEHLNRALDVWGKADPQFARAARARATAGEWGLPGHEEAQR